MAGADLGSVCCKREAGIRSQMRGDFLGLQFVNVQLRCQQRRVTEFEMLFDRIPVPDLPLLLSPARVGETKRDQEGKEKPAFFPMDCPAPFSKVRCVSFASE